MDEILSESIEGLTDREESYDSHNTARIDIHIEQHISIERSNSCADEEEKSDDPNYLPVVRKRGKSGHISLGFDGILRLDKSQLLQSNQPIVIDKKLAKLTMRERLIILCKLGSGASSVVYKALDLQEMKLVALKTIQIHEK
jgi:hypothetical protein